MLYKEFYSELGKLLYAVADVDKVITPAEKKALQDIVKKELVPAEHHVDTFGTNTAYYSEMEFNFLDEEIGDVKAAFESFINFIDDHQTAIDERIKKISLHVVKELANAYFRTNKKEKTLIEELTKKLKKIRVKKSLS